MYIAVHGATTDQFFELDDIRHMHFRDKLQNEMFVLRDWFGELVTLYTIWKYVGDDVVGLEHYRRYFTDSNFKPLNESAINNILTDYDIICGLDRFPYSENSGNSLWHWPLRHDKLVYFSTFIDTLKDVVSVEFAQHCVDYMSGNKFCHGNLFIGKKTIIDEYCEYLFTALAEFSKRVTLNDDNHRICSHISEFLFGAWLTFNSHKIYYNSYHNATLGEIDNNGFKLHINATNDNTFKQVAL